MSVFTYHEARLSVAHHEAGHAVVAMALGLHVVSSEIDVDGDGARPGWSVGGITYSVMMPHRPLAWGTQAAAGELAALTWHHGSGLTSAEHLDATRADHDFREAADTLLQYGFDLAASWLEIRTTAQRTVEALWPEIMAVAAALDQAGRLTGDAIARITGWLVNAS